MSVAILFAYGSLVSRPSLARSLGRAPATAQPVRATLRGYRRAWNVGSDRESHPERTLALPGGRPFTGTMAVLGLREEPDAESTGVLYRLSWPDLEALAVRERNYVLRAVPRHAVVAPSDLSASDAVVVTHLPTPRALERLLEAREAGTAVVRLGYATAVESAFARLGAEDLLAFGRTTTPPDLPVRPLAIRWESAADPAAVRPQGECTPPHCSPRVKGLAEGRV